VDPQITLVTLGVDDLPRAVAFYRDVKPPIREDGRIAFPRG
jgi:catechol 2,3-dioxygenase-like lactoylglutathione lyase family enzyme